MNWNTFFNQTRTLFLVGFITALVWLMAESESLRTERIRPEVRFRVKTDSPRVVRLEPSQDFTGTVTVTVEGPTAAVDALASRARTALDLEPGMPGIPSEPGRHTVNLAEALRAHPLFRDSGVTITSVDPPSATVWEDDLVLRPATVRVEVPEGALLDGPPDPRPPTVSIRLPDSIARAAAAAGGASGDLIATARLTPESLANLPEGRRVALNIPLTLPAAIQAEAVSILPAQVNVELTLRSRAASTIVPNVPVQIRVAPSEIGVWDVDLAPDQRILTDVVVTGPAEMVDQLRAEAGATPKVRLIAYVSLSFEDLDRAASSGKPIEKEVTFGELPTLLRFEPRPRTVLVSARRPEGPPAPR